MTTHPDDSHASVERNVFNDRLVIQQPLDRENNLLHAQAVDLLSGPDAKLLGTQANKHHLTSNELLEFGALSLVHNGGNHGGGATDYTSVANNAISEAQAAASRSLAGAAGGQKGSIASARDAISAAKAQAVGSLSTAGFYDLSMAEATVNGYDAQIDTSAAAEAVPGISGLDLAYLKSHSSSIADVNAYRDRQINQTKGDQALTA